MTDDALSVLGRLEEIERDHGASRFGRPDCRRCDEEYPCDAAQLLAAVLVLVKERAEVWELYNKALDGLVVLTPDAE